MNLGEALRAEVGTETGDHRRLDPQDRAPFRVAQPDRRLFEKSVERGAHLALVQLDRGRLVDRLQEHHARSVQLHAARCLRLRDDPPAYLDDRLDPDPVQGCQRCFVVHERLEDPPAVAYDQEINLPQRSELVQPPLQAHLPANMVRRLGRPDPFHVAPPGLPPIERSSHVPGGGRRPRGKQRRNPVPGRTRPLRASWCHLLSPPARAGDLVGCCTPPRANGRTRSCLLSGRVPPLGRQLGGVFGRGPQPLPRTCRSSLTCDLPRRTSPRHRR